MFLNKYLLNVLFAALLNLNGKSVNCDRMTEKIYENIEVESFCFRRLNATHQTGCASGSSGNVGVIHLVDSDDDLLWVTQNGPHYPYIAALNEDFFNTGNISKMKETKHVSGILVLKSSSSPIYPQNHFSPEKTCPNDNFGFYMEDKYPEYSHCKKTNWNPSNPAQGMLYEDWGIPIVLVSNDSQVDYIKNQCYEKFNVQNGTEKSYPLCAAELSSFMFAAKDSPTCMRRNNCERLGGRNVITFLQPTNQNETIENRSIIVIAARMDAVSMFDKLSPGADSAVSGLVSLLAIASTLSQMRQQIAKFAPGKNVLFSIFNGETFDYIGSSRTVFDMERGEFPQKLISGLNQLAPIKLSHISHFIELSQVALHEDESSGKVWIHTDPISTQDSRVNNSVENMIQALQNVPGGDVDFKIAPKDLSLPPASVQRFLRKDKNISSIVLSNFEKEFSNKFFMSQFDVKQYLSVNTASFIANLTVSVSKAVFKILTNEPYPDISMNVTMVEDMLECYLLNSSCRLFKEVENPSHGSSKILKSPQPYSLYVGVDRDNQLSFLTLYTRYLLAYLNGEILEDRNKDNCTSEGNDHVYQYDWMYGPDMENPGICCQSLAKYTSAVSPAAVLDDWASKEYSTWTESIWSQVTLRIFVKPSPSLEGLTLGIGFAIFISSLIIVYSANKRCSILFGSRALVAC